MRITLPSALLSSLLLSTCADSTTPDLFRTSDFFGEWRVRADATACWEPLDMLFTIDAASIERESPGSMSFSSRWGSPSDATRTRLVSGYVYWNDPGFQTFQIAFYRSGELLAELVADRLVLKADRLEGIFFDPNRSACRTNAAAVKVGP